MTTKGERRALCFLGAVALLGAGTRFFRAHYGDVANRGLDRQIAAVESVPIRGRGRGASVRRGKQLLSRVDVDTATASEIEQLPGIGLALAKRIVDDRNANGTFGCAAALGTVKGIRPATLRRLDSLAAFSGAPRATCP